MPFDRTVTLGQYVEAWLARRTCRIAATTAWKYAYAFRRYVAPALGAVALAELSRAVIFEALSELAGTGLNVHVPYAVLAMALNDAVDAGLLPANPALGLQRRLVPKRRAARSYDARQLALFLAVADDVKPEIAPLFYAMGKAGLRIGEALALHRHDVDPDRLQLRIERSWQQWATMGATKSKRPRLVDITSELAQRLTVVRPSPQGWLFPGGNGNQCRGQSSTFRAMQEIIRAAKLPKLSPHGLRHTAASLWIEQGADLEWVRTQLGHASVSTTQVYASHRRPPRPAFYR